MTFLTVDDSDPARLQIARELFQEYRDQFDVGFCLDGFEDELRLLPGKYAPPSGRLVLVYEEDQPLACGALRDLGQGICEIKRLYVRPEARRRGLARSLSEHLMDFGRTAGYHTVRLDTLRRLTGAVELYEQLGFRHIEAYNDNPEADIVFMERTL